MKKVVRCLDVTVAVLSLVVGIQHLAIVGMGMLWSITERQYSQKVSSGSSTLLISILIGVMGCVIGVGILRDRIYAYYIGFLVSLVLIALLFAKPDLMPVIVLCSVLAAYFLVRAAERSGIIG